MVLYRGAKRGANGICWSRCIVALSPEPARATAPAPAVPGSRQR